MGEERKCEHKDGGDFCFGPTEPDYVAAIPVRNRAGRVQMDCDLCIVDHRYFFIRGCLELPINGTRFTFTWLVWASLSEKNFNRAVDLWESSGREGEPPYFGWLNNRLPGYPDTTELKLNVHTREVGKRPAFEVEFTNHPLAMEQRNGMTQKRAESLARLVALEWS